MNQLDGTYCFIVLMIAYSWFLFFSYHNDARSNTHQICGLLNLNPLNAGLYSICPFQALLGAHHILHVSRVGVKLTK